MTVVPQEHPQTNIQDTDDNAQKSAYLKRKVGRLQSLRLRLRAKFKKQAQVRERGASPASRKRDLDYANLA